MTVSLLLWGALAVLVFWALGAYNRLVRLRSQAIAAFAPVDLQFQRGSALVLAQLPLAVQGGSPATQPLWLALGGAAQQFEASLNLLRTRPLDTVAMEPLRTALHTLRQAWQRMQTAAPDLAGELLPPSLLAQWQAIDLLLVPALQEFDARVAAYNEAVGQFPAVVLAWLFSFKPAGPVGPLAP